MIGRLVGTLVEKDLRTILLDVGGVGYEVAMPLMDLGRVGAVGEKVTLRIHTHVREDALQLFGFLADEGRAAFQTLMSVNGVGPKLALAILSGIEPDELARAVESKDLARLTAIPGVGRKTAERLCVELQGKLMRPGMAPPVAGAPATPTRILMDLQSALLNLGYRAPQVEKVVKALDEQARAGAGMDVLIREALKRLAGGVS
ncbi:MAG: Holliday junction branch migration protein RuvA [Deltaproteobacteria bacterium]|nr:Holliday junction branch migration protein RuvA [Deltaproteobacteria bacterium]